MYSSSPTTSAFDSSDGFDARNGEGLAVDEIMRMKEKRLRLLDDYRNEQEESILPLIREADNINRKRKKKSKIQFHAENNAPLRRSERIMTQTLNGNRTPEGPMHWAQLESDPMSESEYESEFEPEPTLMEESDPEPALAEEPDPEPALMEESDPEPALMEESDSEPASTDESESECETEPQSVLMDGSESDYEPKAISMDESESEPEILPTDESEPEILPVDELGSELELEPEPESTDESEPEFVPLIEPEQRAPPIRRRRFQVVRPGRRFLDVQFASRHIFTVYPVPRRHYRMSGPRLRRPPPQKSDNWYGAREGFDIGHHWNTRLECSHDKVHRPSIAGIHAGPFGAYSVALSGAYPEDVDRGNVVIFTGAGGRDLRGAHGRSRSVRNAPQVRDQELNSANLSLIRSVNTGNPVRLIRGYKLASSYAPEFGYRYDGLYRVIRFWYGRGLSGFRVFRFKMFRLHNQTPPPWETARRAPIPREILAPLPPREATPPARESTPPARESTPPAKESTPPAREPTPPPREPTPPPREPTPPPREPTPPPREPTPPPSTSRGTQSTSAGSSRKRARLQSYRSAAVRFDDVDGEVEECIRKLCQCPPLESDDDDDDYEDPPSPFRGWQRP